MGTARVPWHSNDELRLFFWTRRGSFGICTESSQPISISIITGVYGQAAAQVRGLGGNGKSLHTGEYSIRFGPAYPGGVSG